MVVLILWQIVFVLYWNLEALVFKEFPFLRDLRLICLHFLVFSFLQLHLWFFSFAVFVRYSNSMKKLCNRYMHLTNYSVNKFNSNYEPNSDENVCQGHKWYVAVRLITFCMYLYLIDPLMSTSDGTIGVWIWNLMPWIYYLFCANEMFIAFAVK